MITLLFSQLKKKKVLWACWFYLFASQRDFLWVVLDQKLLPLLLRCLEKETVKLSNILFPSLSHTISFLFSKRFKTLTRNQLHFFQINEYWWVAFPFPFFFFFPLLLSTNKFTYEILWTASVQKNTKPHGWGIAEHGLSGLCLECYRERKHEGIWGIRELAFTQDLGISWTSEEDGEMQEGGQLRAVRVKGL